MALVAVCTSKHRVCIQVRNRMAFPLSFSLSLTSLSFLRPASSSVSLTDSSIPISLAFVCENESCTGNQERTEGDNDGRKMEGRRRRRDEITGHVPASKRCLPLAAALAMAGVSGCKWKRQIEKKSHRFARRASSRGLRACNALFLSRLML